MFFVRFLHNRSVLLINPGVLCEERDLSYLYIFSVVINGGGKDWAVNLKGIVEMDVEQCYLILRKFNFSVRLLCCSIWMLCSCISLLISCRSCNLFIAQLCSLLLSWYWPNNGGDATKVFQYNRSGIFWEECSWYRESRLVGKLRGNVDGDIRLKEGVEGRESVSGNVDSLVSIEMSTGLFTKFGSPWGYFFVTQYGGRSLVVGLLEGFSLICSDVGVEPK